MFNKQGTTHEHSGKNRSHWFAAASVTLLLVFVLLPISVFAVGETSLAPTPTPGGLVVVQGGENMGNVAPMVPNVVMRNIGLLAWHEAGWTGAGQRIGVLDLGFGGLLEFENDTGSAVRLMTGEDPSAYDRGPITHGTQVLRILNAIAPNAQLFACQYVDLASFTVCIDWLIAARVNIINHSAGVPALPLNGQNDWAREVDRAVNQQILWVNAAGNFGGGFISDFFTDNNINAYHEFRGERGIQETMGISSINQSQGIVSLSWESHNGTPANAIDLDLEIIDTRDQVITSSTLRQSGRPDETALEYVVFSMTEDFGVRIRDVSSVAEGVHFVLFIEFANLPTGASGGSVIAPGDSLNALTVGAMQGNEVAPYSSRGPLITGAIKPDMVAPGEITINGQSFIGSSAAAPVVAGVAALVWEANPRLTERQIFDFLHNATQDDRMIPGPDSNYGQGRLYLPLPDTAFDAGSSADAQPTPAPAPTSRPAPTATSRPAPTNTSPPANPCYATAKEDVNLRTGPGVNYPKENVLLGGQETTVIGQGESVEGYLWYVVEGYLWVSHIYVDMRGSCANLPYIQSP